MMRITAVSCALLMSACAVNPEVRYAVAESAEQVEHHRSQLLDSFYLQANELLIGYRNVAPEGQPPRFNLAVTNTRVQDPSRRILLLRGDTTWARTRINLVKVENSDLISSAGVEVQDRRIALLENVGSVAKILLPLALGATQAPPTGCQADLARAPCRWSLPATSGAVREGGSVSDPGVLTISWGAVPVTAQNASTYLASVAGRRLNGLLHSACRDVTVTYVPPANAAAARSSGSEVVEALTWRGRIADPQWLEFVAFPRSGSIELHSQCGASVKSQADPTSPMDAVIASAVAQAAALRAAIDEAGEGD